MNAKPPRLNRKTQSQIVDQQWPFASDQLIQLGSETKYKVSEADYLIGSVIVIA